MRSVRQMDARWRFCFSLFLFIWQTVIAFIGETYFFTINPRSSQRVTEGSKVILECDVNDRQLIVFSWHLDNHLVENTTRRYMDGSNLVIERVNRTLDQGEFTCAAQNSSSLWKIQSTGASLLILWISDNADVLLTEPTAAPLISRGTNISLECKSYGAPAPSIFWYRNTIRIFEEESTRFHLTNSGLRIVSVRPEDNGIISCDARNLAGETIGGQRFLLNVKGPGSAHLREDLFTRTTVAFRDSTVYLHCVFQNATSTNWYFGTRNAMLLSNGTRARVTVYSNGTLVIDQIRKNDEGTYICEGIGRDAVAQTFTTDVMIARLGKLTADNLEPAVNPDKPIVLAQGDAFSVDCLRPSGSPIPSMSWLNYNNSKIQPGGAVFVEDTRLVIERASVAHSGNYTCVAENMAGQRSITLDIVVTVPPVITSPPSALNIPEGEFGQLSCGFTGTPAPFSHVTWFKDGQPIPEMFTLTNHLIQNNETGTLTVRIADTSLEGNYSCLVNTTRQLPARSQSVFLNVIKKLKFDPEPRSRTLELGSTESVTCFAEAEDKPTIRWIRLPASLQIPAHVTERSGTLTFNEIKMEDAGQYSCVAMDSSKVINSTITITVGVSPQITLSPANTTVMEGQSVMIHCMASGDPQPTVNWDQNNRILNTSRTRFSQMANGSLYISPVHASDQAHYGCIVGNVRGLKRVEMVLSVKSLTSHSEDDANLSGYGILDTRNKSGSAEPGEEDASIGIMKTVVIAVCSAVAYLALVIGLTVWCSIRLMRRKNSGKDKGQDKENRNGIGDEGPKETDRLMMNGDGSTVGENGKNGASSNSYSLVPSRAVSVKGEGSSISSPSQKSNPVSSKSNKSDVLQYSSSKLQTIGVLGRGMYGEVFLAKAPGLGPKENQLVYVKSLATTDEALQVEFRQEVEMFSKLNHDRVCQLFAVCKDSEPVYMVMEYCEWGDLKQFLIATRGDNGQQLTIEPPEDSQKVVMCQQVASAMEHISSCRFVLKDLAARNVLLEPNLNVKVACLGLSKDIYASEYVMARSGSLLPLRWTSPEAWLEDDYSTKSDVWSFGCFLFEVFSGGEIPFPNMTNEAIITGFERGDIQHKVCPAMPKQIQTIAYQCWSSSPKDRPDFSQVVTMLSSVRVITKV